MFQLPHSSVDPVGFGIVNFVLIGEKLDTRSININASGNGESELHFSPFFINFKGLQ